MSNIAVAGLGWLGTPLAAKLQQLGNTVKGSTTTNQKRLKLQKNGLNAYVFEVGEDQISGEITGFLEDMEILIILIPPGLRKNTGHNHALRMLQLLKAVETSTVKKVILISSTGVYDDAQGAVNESIPPLPQDVKGKQLVEVEQLFQQSQHIKTTVVRFGGLFGGSRNPVKFLAGRENLNNGDAPVNLIHRTDCIQIILAIIYKQAYGKVFNAVAPQHPTKAKYYAEQARALGLQPPHYEKSSVDEIFKKVDSINLDKILGYTFQVAL